MDSEVKQAVIIASELLVFATLLLIVAVFGQYSRNAFVLKGIENENISAISEYRDIYYYTEGQQYLESEYQKDFSRKSYKTDEDTLISDLTSNSFIFSNDFTKIVKGNDIVNFVAHHPGEYPIIIRQGASYVKLDPLEYNKMIDDATDKDEEISLWDINALISFLGEDMHKEFYSYAFYNDYEYEYKYVLFIEKG